MKSFKTFKIVVITMIALLNISNVNAQNFNEEVRAEPREVTMNNNQQTTVSVISPDEIQEITVISTPPRLVLVNIFYAIINSVKKWFIDLFSNNEGETGSENIQFQTTTNNNGNINISLFTITVNVNSNNHEEKP